MANDLLITAVCEAGLDIDQIAEIAGVDPRTAQRWLSGRVPHPRYRHKLTQALAVSEEQLWPETRRTRSAARLAEIVAAYPRRSDPDAPDWRALLTSAEHEVDLIGYSLSQITHTAHYKQTLTDKATAGCKIRIATADPNTAAVQAADRDHRPPGRLSKRIQATHEQLLDLNNPPLIEVRQHQVATSHTILRFDDNILLTIHLHATPGFQAPLIHLRRDHDYGLFDQLAKHIEGVWQAATPVTSGPASATAPADSPAHTERDRFLDSLDNP